MGRTRQVKGSVAIRSTRGPVPLLVTQGLSLYSLTSIGNIALLVFEQGVCPSVLYEQGVCPSIGCSRNRLGGKGFTADFTDLTDGTGFLACTANKGPGPLFGSLYSVHLYSPQGVCPPIGIVSPYWYWGTRGLSLYSVPIASLGRLSPSSLVAERQYSPLPLFGAFD